MGRMTRGALAALTAILGALGCHSEALAVAPTPAGYEQAVSRLPPQHWALVSRVVLIDRVDGNTYWDHHIEIPRVADTRILYHEVGHLVGMAYPYVEQIHWGLFSHRRNDVHESFAEGYRAHMEGRTQGYERQWWEDVVINRTPMPASPIETPDDLRLNKTVSVCTRADVPSGSIIPGCTGKDVTAP